MSHVNYIYNLKRKQLLVKFIIFLDAFDPLRQLK